MITHSVLKNISKENEWKKNEKFSVFSSSAPPADVDQWAKESHTFHYILGEKQ